MKTFILKSLKSLMLTAIALASLATFSSPAQAQRLVLGPIQICGDTNIVLADCFAYTADLDMICAGFDAAGDHEFTLTVCRTNKATGVGCEYLISCMNGQYQTACQTFDGFFFERDDIFKITSTGGCFCFEVYATMITRRREGGK